jgi:hypothetical protein
LERLKQGKYNKPHWLRYIRGHEPPGPTEEEEEEEEEEEDGPCALHGRYIGLQIHTQNK